MPPSSRAGIFITMTKNEIIYYVGAGIVVLIAGIGNQYGLSCLAIPFLFAVVYLAAFVYPLKK